MDTFEQIKTIILEQVEVEPAKIDMKADLRADLGADSLESVEIVMALEETFGVEISDDVAESLKTVGDLVQFVDRERKAA